jgi:hypothetical protein
MKTSFFTFVRDGAWEQEEDWRGTREGRAPGQGPSWGLKPLRATT